MQYKLFGSLGEFANNEKFARRNVKKSGLNFATHEAILEIIVYNISGGRLDGDKSNMNFFIVAMTLDIDLCHAEQVPSRG